MPKESLQAFLEEECYNRKKKIVHLMKSGIFTKEEIEEIKNLADSIYEKHMNLS